MLVLILIKSNVNPAILDTFLTLIIAHALFLVRIFLSIKMLIRINVWLIVIWMMSLIIWTSLKSTVLKCAIQENIFQTLHANFVLIQLLIVLFATLMQHYALYATMDFISPMQEMAALKLVRKTTTIYWIEHKHDVLRTVWLMIVEC